MTPDIEALAREAGVTHLEYKNWYPAAAVAAIVAKAVEQERERVMSLAIAEASEGGENLPYRIATAIRARG